MHGLRYPLLALAALVTLPLRAQVTFTDVTAGDLHTPILSWGASWVDYDGDGDPDLFASRLAPSGGNRLFRNDGGAFTAVNAGALTDASSPGSLGHTWADFDNDGDLDAYATGGRLYRNDGGTFSAIEAGPLAPGADVRGWAAAWGDYDNDGRVDLVVAHPRGFVGEPHQENHLFHNEGGGAFTRITGTPITDGFAPYTVPSWSDYDLDGDLDLFIGSGPADGSTAPDFLYENEGGGAFSRISTAPIAMDARDGQVMNWIDFDNDGDLDLFVTNYRGESGGIPNHLYRNDGGAYTRVTSNPLGADVTALALANTWGDVDNDGDLDVFVTAGGLTTQGLGTDRLYLNDGAGGFARAWALDNGPTAGATLGDYDGDGDLDLALTSQAQPNGGPVRLYRNDTANENHWLMLDLVGTTSNRSAIGAKVWVTAVIGGQAVTQLREVSAQNTFNGQNALAVHVGLGDAAAANVRVAWPSGAEDVLEGVAADQRLTVTEGQGVPVETGAHPGRVRLGGAFPNPSAQGTTIRYELAVPGPIRLAVYDVLGRRVATLAVGTRSAGSHAVTWAAADDGGHPLGAGVYLVRLEAGGEVLSRSLTVFR